MYLFGPSWDVRYSLFRVAKVEFKVLYKIFFSFSCDKMLLCIVDMRAAHNDLYVQQFCLPPDTTIRLDKFIYNTVLL